MDWINGIYVNDERDPINMVKHEKEVVAVNGDEARNKSDDNYLLGTASAAE